MYGVESSTNRFAEISWESHHGLVAAVIVFMVLRTLVPLFWQGCEDGLHTVEELASCAYMTLLMVFWELYSTFFDGKPPRSDVITDEDASIPVESISWTGVPFVPPPDDDGFYSEPLRPLKFLLMVM
eukprot:TRINITY_DN58102_c0_g1_i1.p1 TRINITY_DN58102_c0_g1~~TRINITY_DN58102_c0_g1_i1.p1  ORF type:complete len:127 (+),score=19.42 TRINITY_DN58102_c0_g1_i1:118-498(+)